MIKNYRVFSDLLASKNSRPGLPAAMTSCPAPTLEALPIIQRSNGNHRCFNNLREV